MGSDPLTRKSCTGDWGNDPQTQVSCTADSTFRLRRAVLGTRGVTLGSRITVLLVTWVLVLLSGRVVLEVGKAILGTDNKTVWDTQYLVADNC